MLAPYVPYQDGFIERDNRTIIEAVRSMLMAENLIEKLWADAARTAAYVLNRVPNLSTNRMGPSELYFENKPRISHPRVFSALSSPKAQEKKRSGYQRKLESRAIEVVSAGYDGDFTFKMYNETTRLPEMLFLTKVVHTILPDYSELDRLVVQLPNGLIFDEDDELENVNVEVNIDEPETYGEAMRTPESESWKKSIDGELKLLDKKVTRELVALPEGKRAIKSKWVFELKRRSDGTDERFEARLVAKGYSQRRGIVYDEIFSPVVRLNRIRLMLSLLAKFDLEIMHFNARTAFLYGTLTEEVYMNPQERVDFGGQVCKLRRVSTDSNRRVACGMHVLFLVLR